MLTKGTPPRTMYLVNPTIFPRIMTNFERIKAMSIEELAKELAKDSACEFCKTLDEQTCDKITCEQGIIQYLESEVVE